MIKVVKQNMQRKLLGFLSYAFLGKFFFCPYYFVVIKNILPKESFNHAKKFAVTALMFVENRQKKIEENISGKNNDLREATFHQNFPYCNNCH